MSLFKYFCHHYCRNSSRNVVRLIPGFFLWDFSVKSSRNFARNSTRSFSRVFPENPVNVSLKDAIPWDSEIFFKKLRNSCRVFFWKFRFYSRSFIRNYWLNFYRVSQKYYPIQTGIFSRIYLNILLEHSQETSPDVLPVVSRIVPSSIGSLRIILLFLHFIWLLFRDFY